LDSNAPIEIPQTDRRPTLPAEHVQRVQNPRARIGEKTPTTDTKSTSNKAQTSETKYTSHDTNTKLTMPDVAAADSKETDDADSSESPSRKRKRARTAVDVNTTPRKRGRPRASEPANEKATRFGEWMLQQTYTLASVEHPYKSNVVKGYVQQVAKVLLTFNDAQILAPEFVKKHALKRGTVDKARSLRRDTVAAVKNYIKYLRATQVDSDHAHCPS
jgi:hypothetical protein